MGAMGHRARWPVRILAADKEERTVRRQPNVQPQMMGSTVEFGASPLKFRCGPDSFEGTGEDVLPLRVKVDDGGNMQIDLTVTSRLNPGNAFFLQVRNDTGIFDGAAPPALNALRSMTNVIEGRDN